MKSEWDRWDGTLPSAIQSTPGTPLGHLSRVRSAAWARRCWAQEFSGFCSRSDIAPGTVQAVPTSTSLSSNQQNTAERLRRAKHRDGYWSAREMSEAQIRIPRTWESSAIYIWQFLLFLDRRYESVLGPHSGEFWGLWFCSPFRIRLGCD